jgi:DNA-binding IclR family transcriptional regulator
LKILEYLAKEEEESTISELSQSFDIPKNSTFRIMKSLEAYGYVEENNRKYHATPRLLFLGYAGMTSKGLVENSIDVMHSLRDDINETVMLGTISANMVVILELLPSFKAVKFTTEVGHMVPIYASAPGKAILSFLPEKEKKAILEHVNFIRFTNNTLPSRKAMFEEIETVQQDGYAIDNGEEISGIICVAAPVFDYRRYPIASVWVTGPDFRVRDKGIDIIGATVTRGAEEISLRYGYITASE